MRIHGRYYEAEFLAWKNMKKRCSGERFAEWYGKVTVCARWVDSYEAFLEDVGRRPSPQHSLDRINPAGNYDPGNVRWADKTTQSRNTKNHKTNKTGVRGVSFSVAKLRWRAAIYVGNRQKHLGYFDDFDDAVAARAKAEAAFWGDK
jgi:hypothetical protein